MSDTPNTTPERFATRFRPEVMAELLERRRHDAEITRLEAENAEDRRDAERLRWIEVNTATLHCNYATPAWTVTVHCFDAPEDSVYHGNSVRAAIDAARHHMARADMFPPEDERP